MRGSKSPWLINLASPRKRTKPMMSWTCQPKPCPPAHRALERDELRRPTGDAAVAAASIAATLDGTLGTQSAEVAALKARPRRVEFRGAAQTVSSVRD